MKANKILAKLVLCGLISFFCLGLIEANAQYQFPACTTLTFPECYDDSCNDPNATWQTYTMDISYPEWPLCTLHVTFCVKECEYPQHSTQWAINGIWVSLPECNNFHNWITNNGSGFDQEKWERSET